MTCIEQARGVVEDMDRDTCIAVLAKHGFGRPGTAVSSDWSTYYHDDELRGFVLECVFPDAE